MHDAYEASPILEKLPLKIESISCYDDVLLVGTKEGHLLQYRAKKTRTGEAKYEVTLERSNKAFSKKPISQLFAVPELFLLISLSDNVVSVHDLTTFGLITTLSRTRGASQFAVDIQRHVSLSGETQATVQMCVATKKKLQLFYWKNRDFLELKDDMTLYDVPRVLTWCKDCICVGFKRDYFTVKVKTGETKELFPTGSMQQEPIVTLYEGSGFIVGRDNMSIFIDPDGNPTMKHPVKWSDIPLEVAYDPPYLIGILPKAIEIRTVEPLLMIQSIDLQKARYICQGNGLLYIASSNHVWRMNTMPIANQIRQLLQIKEFELALRLAKMTPEPEKEKTKMINNIKTLYAVNLFCLHKFEDSMKIFVALDTDPSHVIGLYPNLLPQEFRKQLDYPEKLPDLEGSDLEKGLMALIDYLKDKRREIVKDKLEPTTAIKEGNKVVDSKDQLAQIIDTTLLKCYLQTNDALVAPLLRLKDNKVHVEEAERSLKKKEKFSELIILYEKKGLHEKALSLLMKQAARPNSPLRGHERTVQYLQHLGSEHLKLILEFSEWVLRENPDDGLKIFTEDLPEVEGLPRISVLNFLENISKTNKISKDLAIPYLEHVIYQWHETSEELHSKYAQLLREKVQTSMAEYLRSLPEGHIPQKAGTEPFELGVYRKKLIDFLQSSTYYRPEELLPRFPMDGFFEERAILLGRLGRHEAALGLYVIILEDTHLAEEYCRRHYNKHKPGDCDVYFHLLKVYLQPPEPSFLGLSSYGVCSKPEPNVTAALRLMEEHAGCIETEKALELLPPGIKIKDILVYLENVLELKSATKHRTQVLRNMLFSESLQVHEQRMFYEKEKIVITDLKSCVVCKKRIGNSFFARYPNGVIVHYGCCKDPKTLPTDS